MRRYQIPVAYEKLYNQYRERNGKDITFQIRNINGGTPLLYKTRCVASQADFASMQDGDVENIRTVRIPVGVLNQLRSVDGIFEFPEYKQLKELTLRTIVDNEYFVIEDISYNTFSNLVIVSLKKGG